MDLQIETKTIKKLELPDTVYFDIFYFALRKFVIANNHWDRLEDVARRIFESRYRKVYPRNHPPPIKSSFAAVVCGASA